jgi:hypothetical protein
MPGKASIRKRKRIEQGRREAALQQELKRRQKAAIKLEIAEVKERSKVAEQDSTILVSNEGLDVLSKNRGPDFRPDLFPSHRGPAGLG